MWQRGSSQSEYQPSTKSAGYPYPPNRHPSPPPSSSSSSYPPPQMMPRRGPIDAPPGHQLRRRVTWRSSAYKIIAYLYVLGILYIVWLIRDLFWLPFSYSPSPNAHGNGNGKGNANAHLPKE